MAKIEFTKSVFKNSFILDPDNEIQVKTAEQCFNLVGMMVLGIDKNFNITLANNTSIELTGFSNEKSIIGKNWIDLIAGDDDKKDVEKLLNALWSKKKLLNEKYIYKLHAKDKAVKYIEAKHIPIKNSRSEIIGILISGENITSRIQQQQILKRNINLYETLGDNLPGIDMYMFDQEMEFILAEGKELRNQGFKKVNYKGKSVYEIKNQQLKDIFLPLCISALEGSEISTSFAIDNIDYNIWIIPVRDEDSIVYAGVIIIQNITEEKKKSHELEEARNKAIEANKSKTQFLANVTHEIRTPLNAVLGFAEQLQKTKLSKKQANYLGILENAAEHLMGLVNDLLVLSKIEAGQLEHAKSSFNLRKLVQNIHKTLENRASEKGIEFRYHVDEEIESYFLGDAFRLKQILLNLLGNAIKFTQSGYAELNIYKIKNNKKSVKLRFDIIDTGIGIPKEKVEKVFDQYEQIDQQISAKYGGTGLGLTICKKLVDHQKGSISVKSEPGMGSQFTVSLSFKKVPKYFDHKEPKEQVDQDALKGLKILIVDDDSVNRMLGEIILKNFNCKVETAMNGKIALEKISNKAFDIMLLDIHMPDMSGIEVAKVIRKEFKNSEIKILAFTADVFKKDIKSFRSSGINDYIKKPFKEIELFNKIAKLMELDVEIASRKTSQSKTKIKAQKLYDLKDLYEITNGDKAFIDKMLLRFVENAEDGITQMKAELKKENIAQIGEIAHKLIPSFKHLNIQDIEQELIALKEECKINPAAPEIQQNIARITRDISAVINELKREIRD